MAFHRQSLKFVVELDADEMGELEFQRIVQIGAEGEKQLANEDGADAKGGGGEDEIGPVLGDDIIDEAHGDAGQNKDQSGAKNRHQQGEQALRGEAHGVAENPCEGGHAP